MKNYLLIIFLSLFVVEKVSSQWVEIASFQGTKFHEVCFINENIGFIAGETFDNPVILKTRNAGITWDTIGHEVTGFINSINFIDDSIGFITSGRNIESWIFRTSDQGNTWAKVCDLTLNSFNLSFPTDSIGYAIQTLTEYSLITKSLDKGNTWEVINSFTTDWGGRGVTDFQFITEFIGYMAYESGIVYKTIDGGLTFEEVYLDYQFDLKSMYFLNADTGYVVGEEKKMPYPFDTIGVVIKTSNGGIDWTVINQVFGDCNDVFFINPDTGFIASEDYMIHSFDSGLNWEITDGYFPYYMWSLDFPNSNVGYALGNIQIGYELYSGLFRFDIDVGVNNLFKKYEEVNIFPNPTNNDLTITRNDNISPQMITIFNQQGRILGKYKSRQKTIELSYLKSGIYIIEIEYTEFTTRKKLIIK